MPNLEALPQGFEPRIMTSRTLFVADRRDEALKLAEQGWRKVVAHFAGKGHFVPSSDLSDIVAALDSHVGTPDDVIESLSKDTALARATDIVFQVHSIDPPHSYILRSIELIASKVAPALGWQKTIERSEKRVALVR